MADAVSAYEATLVGDELPGDAKWSGGVLAADGNIYGIPYNATQVLRFDPRTQQATLVGAELPGGAKWYGGVLAADGNIYGIPCDATQVLRFDPRTQQATLVGAELPGGAKWYGGVLAADGNIYGIPWNATQVLRFDPRTQQATLVGAELPGGAKWSGGVLAADGNIYGIPFDATQVLCFDPRTQQATRVGAELPGDEKWDGGVLAADGNIYGIPWNATQVLRFDPRTQQATLVGDQLPGGTKWFGGVLAADGNIYGIPYHATQVLRFDPRTQQATLVGDELPGYSKWAGGVLAADGNIYLIPFDATQVLRFTKPPLPDTGAPAAPGDYASGGVSDAPLGVDRLGCTIYAKAIAATAREAESPSASLCVGIYARWGGGKSFLWTLIQRTLVSLALVETLEMLHEQAEDKTCPSHAAAAAAAFDKGVNRLRDPKAKESAMVDEEDKQRFEKQRDRPSRHTGSVGTCLGGVAGGLSSAMTSLVGLLISLTRCSKALTPEDEVMADQGPTKSSDHVVVVLHEPDSFMGQQQRRRQQSRDAKAAENHAVAVALLMFVLLPLLPLLLPLVSLGAAIGRRSFMRSTRDGLPKMATPADKHAERVLALLVKQGAIGLGEVDEDSGSLITTLRYAVLCIAQSVAFYFASAMSMCADLCKSGAEDGEIPEGATKYLVIEFNAWVYSGVRALRQTHHSLYRLAPI